jgi:predicted membrane-bound mannosyltransferase
LKKRAPFTDLVLWWALTSVVLYAIANEKVPWLLMHQILPMGLLAGYGLAQIEIRTAWQRGLFALTLFMSAVFLLRHVEATNFERAADRHEPLLFAQTTGAYRDALIGALQSTASSPASGVWVAPGQQWPAAWYLRAESPLSGGSHVSWAEVAPDESTLRVVLCSPEAWQGLQFAGKFWSWRSVILDRYIWPRSSWQALAPHRFIGFWLTRKATMANGVLAEDSTAQSVIAWRNPSKNGVH